MNELSQSAQGLLNFIEKSPTSFHTVKNVEDELQSNGYTALRESEIWNLKAGNGYYVTRNQSSILAFRIPAVPSKISSFSIFSAHSDSPCFKLKADFEQVVPDAYTKLNVEKYGGMICSSWMDRPLSVAGRVVVSTADGIETKLIDLKKEKAIIPNVAIHMNRSINEGMAYNAQVDMLPIVGCGKEKGDFKKNLFEEAEVTQETVIGHDLFLYSAEKGYVWGMDQALISAPRLDDLMCVYAGLHGFLYSENQESVVPVLAVFDNEEVGSNTRQGAASSFLEETLHKINAFLDGDDGIAGMSWRLSNSFMISADNAHAVHPNHPEYADAQNRPRINEGIVIKYHAGQQYATDAVSAAIFQKVCHHANVKTQTFVNRSDMRGGSTLGNIAITRVPFLTVDIGIPQLAMHSAFETAGVVDLIDMMKASKTFYETAMKNDGDGKYTLVFGK